MYRSLLAAALLLPAAAHAQPSPPPPSRQMPSYQDNDAQWRGGTSETYGTADLNHNVDQTPPPPPVPPGYGYDPYAGSGPEAAPADGWKTPKPYARADQVDQGRANDAAHRADRARTADLNRRPWRGYNATPGEASSASSGSYAADHARYQAELQRYHDQQSDYEQRMADWRSQASGGPQ